LLANEHDVDVYRSQLPALALGIHLQRDRRACGECGEQEAIRRRARVATAERGRLVGYDGVMADADRLRIRRAGTIEVGRGNSPVACGHDALYRGQATTARFPRSRCGTLEGVAEEDRDTLPASLAHGMVMLVAQRRAQDVAQDRVHAHTWHLRQLVPRGTPKRRRLTTGDGTSRSRR
jgi:hypothetical protein